MQTIVNKNDKYVVRGVFLVHQFQPYIETAWERRTIDIGSIAVPAFV